MKMISMHSTLIMQDLHIIGKIFHMHSRTKIADENTINVVLKVVRKANQTKYDTYSRQNVEMFDNVDRLKEFLLRNYYYYYYYKSLQRVETFQCTSHCYQYVPSLLLELKYKQ